MYCDCRVCGERKDCHTHAATLDDRVMCSDCSASMQKDLASWIERNNRRFQGYAGAIRYGFYTDFPEGVE